MSLAEVLVDLDTASAAIAGARAKLQLLETSPALPPPPAPAPVPAARPAGLVKPEAFYAALRADERVFGGRLQPAQFEGCEADLRLGAGRLPLSWMAYCLATDYHETGHTMQPVHEAGGRAYLDRYDTGRLAAALGNTPEDDDDGILYAGRGKPQVTGRRNYAKANERLHALGVLQADEDLVATPDLMLRMDVAAAALVYGMLEGWFTGKRLRQYLQSPATAEQFENARRIINGTDRAALIAGYALSFQHALQLGDWR